MAEMQLVSLNASELREACKLPQSLNLYARVIMGRDFKLDFPPTHEAYWALLVRAALSGEKELRFALGLPRGFVKTTLVKLFCTWLYAYTDYSFVLVIGARADLAQKIIGDVTDMMSQENYIAIYGNWRTEVARDALDQKDFKFAGRTRILYALGAEGAVRGLNIHNTRPEIIIADDAQTRESAMSPVQNQSFIEWFLTTLYGARSYERCITIYLGNMYNEECMLNQLRKSPDWVSLISAGLLSNGESLWPEFRTKASLLSDYRQALQFGKAHLFLAEVMNDPTAAPLDFFDVSLVPAFRLPIDIEPDACFIVVDPATGKNESDNTAMALIYVIDGKPLVRKIKSGKWADEATVEEALEWCAQYPVSLIAVESVAYQITLMYYINRVIAQRGLSTIQSVPIAPRGVSKPKRIKDFLDKWIAGEVFVHPEVDPTVRMYAVRYNPLKKTNEDDELDVCAYADPTLAQYWNQLQYVGVVADQENGECRVRGIQETNAF